VTAYDRTDEYLEWLAEDDIDGAGLLDGIEAFLSRFVVYPTVHELRAHVLWIAHCWFMQHWDSTPRIAFLSPEPGSGKSRALEVTAPLVPRPAHQVNCTPAYLFRKVSDPDGPPMVLYDEIDTIFGPKAKEHEEIRGFLNAGHRKGAIAGRCVVRGKNVEIEELPAYCAVALAALDDLPDTIMSRSVVIRMRRRSRNEHIEPWRQRINEPEAADLYARLASWSNNAQPLRDGWPIMPEQVTDRNADVWESLLAIAELAGGRWPERARATAVTLVTQSSGRQPSMGVLLLSHIRVAFMQSGHERMATNDLLSLLNNMDEAPWATVRRGESLDSRGLANRLGKYGIGSKALRIGDEVIKGYGRAQFVDAWARYLDDEPGDSLPEPNPEVTSVTDETSQVAVSTADLFAAEADADVTDVTDLREPDPQGDGHFHGNDW
jgi:Protein of unknown function (DUF3631)